MTTNRASRQQQPQVGLDFRQVLRYRVPDLARRGARQVRMEIDQLQAFLAVVDHGSVLAAAEALKQPRSTVRAKLDALEQEFGVPLLTRTRDGAEPTAAGLALVERARAVVNQLKALTASVREDMEVPSGELHLRLPVGPPPELIGMMVGVFRDRYPQVPLHLTFVADPTAQLPPDVDLLFHFGPTVPRGPFRTQLLMTLDEQLLASPAYLAEHGTPQSLDALRLHPLFVWQAPGEDGRSLPARNGGRIPVTPAVTSPDIHILRSMVAAGAGIGLLPAPRLQVSLEVDGLVPVLADLVARPCAVRLVIPEIRAELPRTRAAVALIREFIEGTVGFLPPEEV